MERESLSWRVSQTYREAMGKGAGDRQRPAVNLPRDGSKDDGEGRPRIERAGHQAGRRTSRWSRERIRVELETLLAGAQHWPSRSEFRDAGRLDLWVAISRDGGCARWADEFGVPMRRAGRRRYWTHRRIRRELDRFLAGRDDWPSEYEFEEAGLGGLLRALYEHPEGIEHWVREYGLTRRSNRSWNQARIRRELAVYLAGRSDWPTHDQFKRDDRWNLLKAIYEHGGTHHWAAEFGLQVRLPVDRR